MAETDKIMDGSLQKEISRREAFERKNAELEGVNDQLRLENGELRSQMKMLRKKLEDMSGKPRSSSFSVTRNSSEVQKKQPKEHKNKQSQKKQSTTPVHHTKGDGETEVHTLRREKKALKDELEQTKAKQLNYEGAFQTEFDLRTTIEEKYDSLRERYERLVIESDELRKLLRQHNILLPSPPSIRPKSRTIHEGPLKPPRRNKRATSLQPGDRPKSESVLLRRDGNFTKENLKQGPQSASSEHLHSSLHHSVASPVKKEEFLFTELNKSHGSSEMSGKPTEEANGSKESDHNEDVKERNRKEPDGSNGQQTHKLSSVSDYHKTDVAGHSSTETTNGKENITSTDQADTGYSDKSAGVTITLSTVSDSLDEHKHTNDDDKEIDPLEEESIVSEKGMNKQNESHPSSNDTNLATNEENITGSEKMEWELDSLMKSSAQQLESAKAFYAQMHANLKKKQDSDNDSDDDN